MLKPSRLLTQVFENNIMSQKKLFKHVCNFGARIEWGGGRRVVGSYLGVDTTKNKCCLLNPTPFDCIAGYIMGNSVGDMSLKRLHHRRLNFIDSSILS